MRTLLFIVMPFTEVLQGGLKVMTKRWIYALMVAAIIMVGAIVGPVLAATPGITGAPAPAADPVTVAGPNGMPDVGGTVYPFYTYPNFQWMVYTYSADTTATLVYTVPTGYKFQVDDVIITYYGTTGYSGAWMYRGTTGANPVLATIVYPNAPFEHSFNNLVLNGGEQLKVRNYVTSSIPTIWTITGHWV